MKTKGSDKTDISQKLLGKNRFEKNKNLQTAAKGKKRKLEKNKDREQDYIDENPVDRGLGEKK